VPSTLKLISVEQLGKLPPTEILGKTRLIARGLNVIYGASGAYKSFYTLDAALSVAQTAPVIYVAAEGVGGMFKRVSAWCEHNNTEPGQILFLCEEVNLLDSSYVKNLIEIAAPINPALVAFDTLARCIPGGDENSAKDMGLAVRNSTIIQRTLSSAIAWIHHTNRADKGERGSGAIRGAADAMIEISANGDSVIRVSCSKLKDDDPWATEELKFLPVGASGVLVPSTGTTAKLSAIELQILEFIALPVFETSGARAIQIVNGLNISERHVYRMLSHLKEELTLMHGSRGDPYHITGKGLALICKPSAKRAAPVTSAKSRRSKATDTTDNDMTFEIVM
jgi:hypothetical protein